MLDIAIPDLRPAEWERVKAALGAVADCGCGAAPAPSSLRARLGKAMGMVAGAKPRPELPAHHHAVRAFLCDTRRARRLSHAHIPMLDAQGYSRAEIHALAILGA